MYQCVCCLFISSHHFSGHRLWRLSFLLFGHRQWRLLSVLLNSSLHFCGQELRPGNLSCAWLAGWLGGWLAGGLKLRKAQRGLAGWLAGGLKPRKAQKVIRDRLVTWAILVEDGSGDSDRILGDFFRGQYGIKSLVLGHFVPLPLPQGRSSTTVD